MAPEQDSVEVAEVTVEDSATLVGDSVQVRPVEGDTVSVRLTVPVNPPEPVTVMVEVPVAPARIVTVVGLADKVKAAGGLTLNVTVTECEREPLVPVTDTCFAPVVVKVQDNVELPEPVTLVGDTEQEVLLVARLTTPVKPFTAVIVMVELAAMFCVAATVDGLAAIVKS